MSARADRLGLLLGILLAAAVGTAAALLYRRGQAEDRGPTAAASWMDAPVRTAPGAQTEVPDVPAPEAAWRLLRDRTADPALRNRAIDALGLARDRRLPDGLHAIATDPQEDWRMHAYAIQHLGRIWAVADDAQRERSARLMIGLAKDRDADHRIRREALLALASDPQGSYAGVVQTAIQASAAAGPTDPLIPISLRIIGEFGYRGLAPMLEEYRASADPALAAAAVASIAALERADGR